MANRASLNGKGTHVASYANGITGGVALALCKKVLVAAGLAATAAEVALVLAAKDLSVAIDKDNKTMYRDYYKSLYERITNGGYTKVRITGHLSDRYSDYNGQRYYFTWISGTPRTYGLFKNNQWIIAP